MYKEFEILLESLADAQYAEAISGIQFGDVLIDFDRSKRTDDEPQIIALSRHA